MSDEKMFLSFDDAVGFLSDKSNIHTFRNGSGMLVGADWSRRKLIEAMRAAPEIEVTGDLAQSMKHGLAIRDHVGVLFIETARRTDDAAARPAPEGKE